MPTYDYQCDACDASWELFQKMTDEPIKKCPECGKNKARRLFGIGAAVMFKGSGFYETDYRSKSYEKSAEADKQAAKDSSDSGGDSKSDSANKDATAKSESKAKSEAPTGKTSKGKDSPGKNSGGGSPSTD